MYMYLDDDVFHDPEDAQRYYLYHPNIRKVGFYRDGIKKELKFDYVHNQKNIFERIYNELLVKAACCYNSEGSYNEMYVSMQDDLACFCLTPIAERFGQIAEEIYFNSGRWALDNERCAILAQRCALYDIESGLEQNKGLDQLTDEYQNLDSQELLYQYDLKYEQTMYSKICSLCRKYENVFGRKITENNIDLMTVPFISRDVQIINVSRCRNIKEET